MATLPIQAQKFRLAGSGISATDTSITLQSFQTPDETNITNSELSTTNYGTLEPGTVREEIISFTAVTQNANGTATLTGVTRGLQFATPYTASAALRQAHAGGTIFVLTNNPQLYNDLTGFNNDETITGIWTFTDPNVPRLDSAHTYGAGEEEYFATKRYADSLAISGAPDMSTTQKGIAEEATQAETDAGTTTGGTGARLAVNPGAHLETWDQIVTTDYEYGDTITAGDVVGFNTAINAKWVRVNAATAAGADQTFGIALESGVDTDTSKRVLLYGVATTVTGLTTDGYVYLTDVNGTVGTTPGTYNKVLGVSPDGASMIFDPFSPRISDLPGSNAATTTANFNESMTFFNTTDITGAEAETLSDGSNADALHIHAVQVEKQEINTTDVSISNDATENDLFSTSIAGGTLGTNNGLRFKLYFKALSLLAGASVTLRLYYAATNVASITITNATAGTINTIRGYSEGNLLASGATNTQEGTIYSAVDNQVLQAATSGLLFNFDDGTSAIDSTANQDFKVTAQFSAANASNAINVYSSVIEIIR